MKTLTMYDQCMHFRVVNNNFLFGGYPRSFNGNQDNYILSNKFVSNASDSDLIINSSKSSSEYNIYFENNQFNDENSTRLNGDCSFINNYIKSKHVYVNGINTQFSKNLTTNFLKKY